jgi:diadenosine tetraphosphate (Ap4A) HIT family hydrolase
MAEFEIHAQLLLDTYRLGRMPLCHLLLHRNGVLPWFILVPETGVADLLDLAGDLRAAVIGEASRVADFIKHELACPKINFAAIGNVVPQLHLHVVGRKPADACWPAPVWGNLSATRQYTALEIGRLKERLERFLGAELVLSRE